MIAKRVIAKRIRGGEGIEMSTNRYSPESVKRLVAAIAGASGVSKPDAAILADALVDADLHGTSTHGVSRLKIYLERIRRGLIDPAAQLHVTQRRPAVLAIDACNGLGQVQAIKVLDRLIPSWREFGVASASIQRSQHFGAASYYRNRASPPMTRVPVGHHHL